MRRHLSFGGVVAPLAIALALAWFATAYVQKAEGGVEPIGDDFAVTSITADCDGSGLVYFSGTIPAGGLTLTLMTKAADDSGPFFPAPGVPVLMFAAGTSPLAYQFDLTNFDEKHYRVDSNFNTKSPSLNCEDVTPTVEVVTQTPVPTVTPTPPITTTTTPTLAVSSTPATTASPDASATVEATLTPGVTETVIVVTEVPPTETPTPVPTFTPTPTNTSVPTYTPTVPVTATVETSVTPGTTPSVIAVTETPQTTPTAVDTSTPTHTPTTAVKTATRTPDGNVDSTVTVVTTGTVAAATSSPAATPELVETVLGVSQPPSGGSGVVLPQTGDGASESQDRSILMVGLLIAGTAAVTLAMAWRFGRAR